MDDRLYDLFAEGGASYIATPEIPSAGDDLPAIPARRVRFLGFPVTIGLVLRQANRLVEGAAQPRILGASQWAVTMNGALVYCPESQARDPEQALLEAIIAIGKLRRHPVAWWDEADWRGRPAYFRGVPAVVAGFTPERGQALLRADGDFRFPKSFLELEEGAEPGPGLDLLVVDILNPEVIWTRTRAFTHNTETPDVVQTEGAIPQVGHGDSVPPAVESPTDAEDVDDE